MNDDITFIINKSGYGKENWKLQQRINKAIEYIEYYLKDIDNLDDVMINSIIFKEILEILKGSDSNE